MAYSITIVSIRSIYSMYQEVFAELAKKYQLSYLHRDDLYDWLVTHAVSEVLRLKHCSRVLKHTPVDPYLQIYRDSLFTMSGDSLGYRAELAVDQECSNAGIVFRINECIKLTVLDDIILIARSTCG